MTELAKADSVQTLKDAPAPGTTTANLVADTINQLKTMTGNVLQEQYNKDDTVLDYDTAYSAKTDNSSTKTKICKSRRNRKERKPKDKDDSDGKEKKKKKNDFPHCKKFNRRHPHPRVPKEKCFWNKKYKAGTPEQYVMSWRLISNPAANSQSSWEDIRRRTANDGVGG